MFFRFFSHIEALPMWTRIIFPVLLIVDLAMAIRGQLHSKFINWVCTRYHGAARKYCGPWAESINDFLKSRAGPSDRLTAVEIGSGPFPLLDAYPRGTRLVCVDPSPEFNEQMREAWNESHLHGNGELILHNTFAEDLSGVIADNFADVIVSRCVNCSVADMDKAFAQYHRILKKGGRYYFWDHIRTDNWMLLPFQMILSYVPVIAYFTNCTLMRLPFERLRGVGFSDVKVEFSKMPLPHIFTLYSRTATGYGVK